MLYEMLWYFADTSRCVKIRKFLGYIIYFPYICSMFLFDGKAMSKSKSYQVPEAAPSLVADMLKRLEELALLKEGWDGENSVSIDSGIQDFLRRVIMLSSDKELVNWVLVPDARGYLYLDYTEGKNLAGITIAPHQIVAFIKRDGHLSKYNYDHLNEQDVLNLLEEAHIS